MYAGKAKTRNIWLACALNNAFGTYSAKSKMMSVETVVSKKRIKYSDAPNSNTGPKTKCM